MNKKDDSNKAIEELETTQEITILPNTEDEELAKTLLRTNTKADVIRQLQIAGYSEFIIGTVIGFTLATENKIEMKRDRVRRWTPSFLRKQ